MEMSSTAVEWLQSSTGTLQIPLPGTDKWIRTVPLVEPVGSVSSTESFCLALPRQQQLQAGLEIH